MGKRFFFKLIRFLCKHGGFCLFKYEVYMQPNSKYIENNYENSKGNSSLKFEYMATRP